MTASSLDEYDTTSTTSQSHLVTKPPSYSLIVRQQPEKARLCSFKEKVDRRPLDPPPIVQLFTDKRDIQYSGFFLYATLVNEGGGQDLTFLENTRTTAGTTVQSLHCIKDGGNEGAFFIFADVSIRMEGLFRLRFTLFEIMESHSISRCSVLSDVFQVYSPKSFPGMSESTLLTRSFSEQGVRIRIRKETRSNSSPPSKRRRSDGDNDNDDVDETSATPMSPSSPPNSLPQQHIQPLPPVIKSTQSIMSMKNILISPIQEGPAIENPINSFPLSSSSATRLPYSQIKLNHHFH
ncbi:unnamed protein product [Absidia cylindrospora]